MPLCVKLMRDFVLREILRVYDVYAFLLGRGEGFFFVFSGVMMFLFWHICAASACKHEPF